MSAKDLRTLSDEELLEIVSGEVLAHPTQADVIKWLSHRIRVVEELLGLKGISLSAFAEKEEDQQ